MIWREACARCRKNERMHSRQSSRISQRALYAHRIARHRHPASEILPRSHTLRVFSHSVVTSVRTFLTVFVRTRPCVPDKKSRIVRQSLFFVRSLRVRSHRVRSFTRCFGYAPCLLVSRAREASPDGRAAGLVRDGRIRRSDRWRFLFLFGKRVQKHHIYVHQTPYI